MSSYKITSGSDSLEIVITSERISVKGDNDMAMRVRRLCGYSGLNWPLISDSEIQALMGASSFRWDWSIVEDSSAQKESVVDQTATDEKLDSSEDVDEEPAEKRKFKFSV